VTCERITTDPDVMAGLPCIRGLRFPVATVVAMVADGMTADEILAEHPDLTTEDIHESLLYAAEAVRERELPLRHTACNSSSTTTCPPLLAEGLKTAGHDAVHLRDLDMQAAPDPAVLQRAQVDERVLVSADTDFGSLLSRSRATGPVSPPDPATARTARSRAVSHHPGQPGQIAEDLTAGAIVVIGDDGIRIRRPPMPG